MKVEKLQVFGLEASIRAMRNPKDSWALSDSYIKENQFRSSNFNIENFFLGDKDMKLAQELTKAGSEHSKFLRQIHVWFDLTAPRYMWSEFDTYHYNTKNSCSTMHTAHKRHLTQADFEYDILINTLGRLNWLITERKEMRISAEEFIHCFKNELPEGFLQKRTVDTNYAELLNIYKHRKNHRLTQWREFCDAMYNSLPYFRELTGNY